MEGREPRGKGPPLGPVTDHITAEAHPDPGQPPTGSGRRCGAHWAPRREGARGRGETEMKCKSEINVYLENYEQYKKLLSIEIKVSDAETIALSVESNIEVRNLNGIGEIKKNIAIRLVKDIEEISKILEPVFSEKGYIKDTVVQQILKEMGYNIQMLILPSNYVNKEEFDEWRKCIEDALQQKN